ncbi:aldo/keto reductase [Acetobacterium woodii]|uniref:Putative oxidoreductases of the aldo/keto reductase family n=1 Tax=Acetobacterium woodii (strain ATCC 29683 / DSM 1030 / JCM 2381 / KCTC 1655 / WB1) TaxID=931626 RepID=H6LDX9_ACEWD|nr:aldo/keto reductase [Acetobacterium woodii]AFA48022.1 putative oxidoreductases of the aldo/keto reductase family [Acetobacterium woodii DSM 1030]
MKTVILGKTNIEVNKNGFGALPIQRIEKKDAVYLLQKAFYNGINYFDTARWYSDSEEKMGAAFSWIRDKIIISTKTAATNADSFWNDLEMSLKNLQTDYIDIYQFHNPSFCPRPGDESGLYDAMLKAKEQGKIRFIGITNHRLAVAEEAVMSNLYDTLQFPFCYLATAADVQLVKACKEKEMGFIAMKALSGGLITDAKPAYAYLNQFDHVAPIWGIQKESELDEFISFQEKPPVLTEAMRLQIEKDRQELSGNFCRGCGYCMPCPAEIEISMCARMSLMLRRAPQEMFLSEEWQEKMKKIENCLHCNQCVDKCPYELNTPKLLEKNYEDYQTFL